MQIDPWQLRAMDAVIANTPTCAPSTFKAILCDLRREAKATMDRRGEADKERFRALVAKLEPELTGQITAVRNAARTPQAREIVAEMGNVCAAAIHLCGSIAAA